MRDEDVFDHDLLARGKICSASSSLETPAISNANSARSSRGDQRTEADMHARRAGVRAGLSREAGSSVGAQASPSCLRLLAGSGALNALCV
jgi:hypothetical protein